MPFRTCRCLTLSMPNSERLAPIGWHKRSRSGSHRKKRGGPLRPRWQPRRNFWCPCPLPTFRPDSACLKKRWQQWRKGQLIGHGTLPGLPPGAQWAPPLLPVGPAPAFLAPADW